eukprot:3569256-Prymnesium_polylepis.1
MHVHVPSHLLPGMAVPALHLGSRSKVLQLELMFSDPRSFPACIPELLCGIHIMSSLCPAAKLLKPRRILVHLECEKSPSRSAQPRVGCA